MVRQASKKVVHIEEARWKAETVYFDGDEFFNSLERAILSAKAHIELETYIFTNEVIGRRIMAALSEAAKKRVVVRLMVDGIGSSGWAGQVHRELKEAGVLVRVFNELPWERWLRSSRPGPHRLRILRLLFKINSRDHRKVCVIDGRRAFVGSFNICDDHSRAVKGDKAWRDTGAEVIGSNVKILQRGFDYAWFSRVKRLRRWLKGRRRLPRSTGLVRLNVKRRQRKENYEGLLRRLNEAKKRIWITNAYFVPHHSLLTALTDAATRGVDVRILTPRYSDVFFLPWVSSAFHYGLLKAGVRIYEYLPSMLHAKTMLIDDWMLVGSSNLNHRSLMHDLEADVVLTAESSRVKLENRFQLDLAESDEIDLTNWSRRPWWERWGGWCLLAFRSFL